MPAYPKMRYTDWKTGDFLEYKGYGLWVDEENMTLICLITHLSRKNGRSLNNETSASPMTKKKLYCHLTDEEKRGPQFFSNGPLEILLNQRSYR